MELTFVNDLGQTFPIDIDPTMELENVMALLEAESGIPVAEQSISYDGRELSDPKATLLQLGVSHNAILFLRRKVTVAGRSIEQDAEMMRLQILGDPNLMRQLQETQPDLAAAVISEPRRFAELLRQMRTRQDHLELARQREIALLNADPFDVQAQGRIEEAIRQQAVLENMEHALEYSPESFGRVTMLYVPVEVNGHPVKAFVDSGAQQTIMSPECAEACGIMRLVDKRFAGIARGVGTANILGRVHSAQLKLADLYLPCSFTIMEGRDVDLLLGLDMLKGHRACIDLEKNVLRIQGREVKFLSEHELPVKARDPIPQEELPTGRTDSTEEHIETLMGLGATREMAVSLLNAAGGNVDAAASMLFILRIKLKSSVSPHNPPAMSFNVTMQDALYPSMDFASLNWFEKQWVAWYIWIANPIIATGLMSFILHEVVYFGRCVPWLIFDAIPYFRQWKLQPNKVPTPQEQWECTKQVLFSHFTIELPAIWLFNPMAEAVGMQTYQVPFPSWKTMAPQIAFFFVFEDFFHFLAHQALHTPTLYKHIHKLHHKFSAPFGLAAEYAHPAEVFILGTGTIAGPILYCYFTHNLHILTVYIWISLRLFQAIDAHSGYDFPWSLQHILPFWSGADHHDFHHMAFTNNYSTSFRWWDRIFGTDDKYIQYKARLKAAKDSLKNASIEKQREVELKLIEEMEEEGLRAEAQVEHKAKIH